GGHVVVPAGGQAGVDVQAVRVGVHRNVSYTRTAVSYRFSAQVYTGMPWVSARAAASLSRAASSASTMQATSVRAATAMAFTLPITVSHTLPLWARDMTQLSRSPT